MKLSDLEDSIANAKALLEEMFPGDTDRQREAMHFAGEAVKVLVAHDYPIELRIARDGLRLTSRLIEKASEVAAERLKAKAGDKTPDSSVLRGGTSKPGWDTQREGRSAIRPVAEAVDRPKTEGV